MPASRELRAAAYENPRPEVAALVPATARRVLDLGCSSGALGASLPGAHVVGVELDPELAADAAGRLGRVIVGDVATVAIDEADFDVLICADVLEHLVDPWSVLRARAQLLAPGGIAVISLPNVRHWETFWQLGVRGVWPRRAAGIHDATHLRWFTLTDAYELIEGAGLRVERVERVIRVDPRKPSERAWLARVPLLRPFVTFQHLLVARRV